MILTPPSALVCWCLYLVEKRGRAWTCSQWVCFMVSPKMGVRSTFTPAGTLNSSCCSKMARKRKISHLARTSPIHRRLPMPKIMIFSLKVLLIAVPSAVRNRSGRNSDGSPHTFLQEEQRRWDFWSGETLGEKAWGRLLWMAQMLE